MPTLPQGNTVSNSPLLGTDESGAGVTGTSNLGPGVLGQSLGLVPGTPAGVTPAKGATTQPGSDGVLGEGNNGVRGVSAAGWTKATGFSVAYEPPVGAGVWGTNTADGTGFIRN
jgi:hypothetical protein